jgi:hypothetical protein
LTRVTLIGRSGRSQAGFAKTTAERFRETGNNTGNNLFFYAVSQQIGGDKRHALWDTPTDLIRAQSDAIVIVAANWIYDHFDLGPVARILEATDVPTVVVGLGVQAPHENVAFNLKPGTERLLAILRERNIPVCARGEATARLLEANWGVRNVVPTGCPSNFINPAPDLGARIAARAERAPVSALISLEASPSHKAANEALIRQLAGVDWRVVLQDPQRYLEIIRAPWSVDEAEAVELLGAAGLWHPEPGQPFHAYVLRHLEAFYDTEAWIDYASRLDFATGTKLHGNMACLQGGVPTVFLSHDLRTAELADIMQVPHVSRQKALTLPSPAALWEEARFSAASYDARRLELATRYADVLVRSGIPVSPSLLALTREAFSGAA